MVPREMVQPRVWHEPLSVLAVVRKLRAVLSVHPRTVYLCSNAG